MSRLSSFRTMGGTATKYIQGTSSMIDYIYTHFMKAGSVQPGSNPGFGHAMKLSYNTMDLQRMSITGPKSLCYRYKLSPDVPRFTTGLLTALMDELSTVACFRVGLPSAPGLSLQMQTELIPSEQTGLMLDSLEELDIDTVVTKLGRTVSFTKTHFRDAKTQELVGFSSHVKYMPTGSRLMDWVFTNRFLYDLYEQFYLRSKVIPIYEEGPLVSGVLQPHLDFVHPGRATFGITSKHTNPFGSLHGGCHAMIMEMVGKVFAKDQLGCESVLLEAMQIDYLGAGKVGRRVEVVCERLGGGEEAPKGGTTLQVRVLIQHGDRICSDGKLRFSRVLSRL